MKKKPDNILQKDWEDVSIPELTDEDFTRMRPARDVLPALIGEKAAADLIKQRGRPKKDHPKKAVSLRLDEEVIDYFKSTGRGWQSRMGDALKEWMQEHKAA